MTKLNDALQIFLYHTKGQSLCYSDTNSCWWATPPSLWNLRSKWPTPFEKRRLQPISAHNVSTVGDSEKSSITNIKSTTGFPTSHRWSAYVTHKWPKGWLKERFFRLMSISQRVIVSAAVNLVRRLSVLNIWWSAAILITPTVDKCMQQLGRVEEIVWLPYHAGLSAPAETLVGIHNRVIVSPAVYPRFVEIAELARSLCHSWATCFTRRKAPEKTCNNVVLHINIYHIRVIIRIG